MDVDCMAHEIAETSARELVESSSVVRTVDGVEWRDLTDDVLDYLSELELELSYLERRGILRRHPTEKLLVHMRTDEERAAVLGNVRRRYDDPALKAEMSQ
jgi:hypothetical protein